MCISISFNTPLLSHEDDLSSRTAVQTRRSFLFVRVQLLLLLHCSLLYAFLFMPSVGLRDELRLFEFDSSKFLEFEFLAWLLFLESYSFGQSNINTQRSLA